LISEAPLMFQKRRSQKPIIEVVCVYIGKSDSCKENRTRYIDI